MTAVLDNLWVHAVKTVFYPLFLRILRILYFLSGWLFDPQKGWVLKKCIQVGWSYSQGLKTRRNASTHFPVGSRGKQAKRPHFRPQNGDFGGSVWRYFSQFLDPENRITQLFTKFWAKFFFAIQLWPIKANPLCLPLRYPRGSMKIFQKWIVTEYIKVFGPAEHDGDVRFCVRCGEKPPPLYPILAFFRGKNG